jgi:hypothetical protein
LLFRRKVDFLEVTLLQEADKAFLFGLVELVLRQQFACLCHRSGELAFNAGSWCFTLTHVH